MTTASIYLDNSTTTRPSEKAISSMMPYWTTYWGSTSAPHQKGQELFPALTAHFKTLYECIGASEEDQLILTSSGAEAINHVVASVYRDVTIPSGRNQFLMGAWDEAASMMAINHLEPMGCVSKMIPVNGQGMITAESIIDRLSPRTALISISWGNGLTGVIQPLEEIAALCKERGVRLHLDATHIFGKFYYDLKETGADYLTLNGEQCHGPKGSGLLYIKKGMICSPFIFGSADQAGMRAGGLNMPSLAGLACAIKKLLEYRNFLCTETAH